MILNINDTLYKINDDEYPQIHHNEYNNLRLYKNIDIHERLIGLIIKLKECFIDNFENYFISFNTSHGGFIPLNLSKKFNSVILVNTKIDQLTNIRYNIKNNNITNCFDSFDNISTYKEQNIIMLDNYDIFSEYFNNNFLIIKKNNNLCETLHKSHYLYSLRDSDYVICITLNKNELFKNVFKYYIENEELYFDNLINLCIMVKNAGPQFEQMLKSNLSLIDKWTILDTGSTDETIEIINRVLVGKKEGNLYCEPFINFKDSRNRLIDLAKNDCKFILMLDDTYIIKGELRNFLNLVRSDQYSNSFSLFVQSDDTLYNSNRIIKSNSGLKYIYKIHEVISPHNNKCVVIPQNVSNIFDMRFDYMEKRTMER